MNTLKGLGPRVMLVEEAGQVLEAHVLGSLVPTIEHLILIGDPLQLRPTLNNYRLSSLTRPHTVFLSHNNQSFLWTHVPVLIYTDLICRSWRGCQGMACTCPGWTFNVGCARPSQV